MMKRVITLKLFIFLAVLMTTFSHLYSADGDSVANSSPIEAVPISGHTYLRDRHEWFTAGLAIGPMGLNVRLTSPAIRLISAPIILPYIFPYPVRLFMGFRY